MFNPTSKDYLIYYRIPSLEIYSQIIVEALSENKARESLRIYLNKKHEKNVDLIITDVDLLGRSQNLNQLA